MGRSKQAVPKRRIPSNKSNSHVGVGRDDAVHVDVINGQSSVVAGVATAATAVASTSTSSLRERRDRLWVEDNDNDSDDSDDYIGNNEKEEEEDLFLGRIPLLRRQQEKQKQQQQQETQDTISRSLFSGGRDANRDLNLLFAAELLTEEEPRSSSSRSRSSDSTKKTSSRNSKNGRLSKQAVASAASAPSNHDEADEDEDNDEDEDEDESFLYDGNHRNRKQREKKAQQRNLKKHRVIDDDDDDDDNDEKDAVKPKAKSSSSSPPPQRRRVHFAVQEDRQDGSSSTSGISHNKDKDKKSGKEKSQQQQQRAHNTKKKKKAPPVTTVAATRTSKQAQDNIITCTASESIQVVLRNTASASASSSAVIAGVTNSTSCTNSSAQGTDDNSTDTIIMNGSIGLSGAAVANMNHKANNTDFTACALYYTPSPPRPQRQQPQQNATKFSGNDPLASSDQDCFEISRFPVPENVRIVLVEEQKQVKEKGVELSHHSGDTSTVDNVQDSKPYTAILPVTTGQNIVQLGRVVPSLSSLLLQNLETDAPTTTTTTKKKKQHHGTTITNTMDDHDAALLHQDNDDTIVVDEDLSSSSFCHPCIVQSMDNGLLRVDLVLKETSPRADAAANSRFGSACTTTNTTTWFVRIAICRDIALRHCHATQLPLLPRTASMQAKRYQPARQFHVALAKLFPSRQLLHDTARLFESRPTYAFAKKNAANAGTKNNSNSKDDASTDKANAIITAKQVYELTDNRQLQRVLQGRAGDNANDDHVEEEEEEDRKQPARPAWTEKLKGVLLPTLRPYQEAAVDWMLQREQEVPRAPRNSSSDEWKLAWVVLVQSSRQPHDVMPLNEYKQKYNEDKSHENILLFCPFTGWLADSIEQAKYMMISASDISTVSNNTCSTTESTVALQDGQEHQHDVKGGILADAMGLGKSVEVLACILANPRPVPPSSTATACITAAAGDESNVGECVATASSSTTRRCLNYGENNEVPSTVSTTGTPASHTDSTGSATTNKKEGVVEDFNEFGDANSDDDDDGDDDSSSGEARKDSSSADHSSSIVPSTPQKLPAATSAENADAESTRAAAVPVTPDDNAMVAAAEVEDDEAVEERWLENNEPLGSCICGNLVGLDDLKSTTVFCPDCSEPMHMECAGFASTDEMERATSPLVYRRLFTNERWTCRLLLRPTDESHCQHCPCCVVDSGRLVKSRATIIVTPPAILSQWKREIQRHTLQQGPDGKPLLRVVVYEGIAKTGQSFGPRKEDVASHMALLHPHKLADSDIVLLTFDTLRADLHHSNVNPFITSSPDGTSNRRKRKRYRVVPSPLPSIQWWRVCLDEAQRVESTIAASAQMALKLQGEHRWCVTGTPIGHGKLEDLYGLLLFLRMSPFSWKLLFDKCFNVEYHGIRDRIQCLLANVFWRSTKEYDLVREQMKVPEQQEVKVQLRFSSIEKHFYDRQLEQTILTAGDVCERERSGKKRKRKELTLLAEHLHRLRAACCHPQVGSSGLAHTNKQRHGRRKKQRRLAEAAGDRKRPASMPAAGKEKEETSVVSRVMTMDEILARFIEDAKLKCEESQRLAVMHTNAMAAISRLKVEARDRGIETDQSDAQLLSQSCKLYLESLDMAEANARPMLVLGNAEMAGTTGFLSSRKMMKDGVAHLDWKLPGSTTASAADVWARLDFVGHSRRLVQVCVRPIREIPVLVLNETSDDFVWKILHPKTVIFQVSSAAVGGEFVDVGEMTCPPPTDSDRDDQDKSSSWVVESGFRTNKSKSWRLLIKSYYDWPQQKPRNEPSGQYIGLEVQLYEPDIASDPLQRLHCLHNASLSFTSLLQIHGNNSGCDEAALSIPSVTTPADLNHRLTSMKKEAEKIESLYMDVARSLHSECNRRFEEASRSRFKLEEELLKLSRSSSLSGNKTELEDCWDDGWWDDFLVMCHLHGSEAHQRTLYERVLEELDRIQGGPERGLIRFPTNFRDLNGLRVALQSRMRGIRDGIGKEATWIGTRDEQQAGNQTLYQFREDRFRCSGGAFSSCMQEVGAFSTSPSDKEMFENSHCRVCKEDWNQQGPKCRHCIVGDQLNELEPDRVTLCLLNALHGIIKSPVGRAVLQAVDGDNATRTGRTYIDERAKKFFDILESQRREKILAWRHWRTHLDLLNDLDELGQCKASMRLSLEGEDLTALTEDQLNAVVMPFDLNARYHEHAAKQGMGLGDLRRAKDTLRYLRNQSAEQEEARNRQEEEQCLVCHETFDTDRAVLQCGHSFHLSPCLERLKARSAGGGSICCPLRCKVRTHPSKVMIASEKRHDDGSRSKRKIQGSWGTKVTRLVSDMLGVQDVGDKAVIFSQWDDMLDIVQEALLANGIRHVRATSAKATGDVVNRFRAIDCTALLLNVKNGAEGLTIVEATHVFMVEPLMNHGLDSQAINRVHRIGQTRKTYVHRYVMSGTVEVKIDALRMEHEGENVEDALQEAGKKSSIICSAGGIDGGFRSEAELLELLHMEDNGKKETEKKAKKQTEDEKDASSSTAIVLD